MDLYFAFKNAVLYPSNPVVGSVRHVGEGGSPGGLDFPLSGQATVTLQDFLASYEMLDHEATLIETAIVYEPMGPSLFSEYVPPG